LATTLAVLLTSIPSANWVLLVGVLLTILGFGSSSAMAGAYGIVVTVTMLITTLLTFFVVRQSSS